MPDRLPPDLVVRRALVADALAIADISIRGWQAAYRGIFPDDFLDSLSVTAREAGWREMLGRDTDGKMPAWLAERPGVALGFVSSGPPRDEDVALPAAEIYAIYVRPEHWGQGIGSRLLSIAVDHWQALGSKTLTLWVLEANEDARAFYESQGWRPDGTRQDFEVAGVSAPEVRYRLVVGAPPLP